MANNWSVVWDCIFGSLRSIYQAMNSIKIFDLWGSNYISLWDFCIAIIVMGAIINLFINFTTPTLPDSWSPGVASRARKNSYAPIGRKVDSFYGRFGFFY